MPSVKEIVKEYLEENGYGGLVDCDCACGCQCEDLFPCGDMSGECEAGHKVPCDPETCELDGDCEWHIAPGLPKNLRTDD